MKERPEPRPEKARETREVAAQRARAQQRRAELDKRARRRKGKR
jgi:hypothetical protein